MKKGRATDRKEQKRKEQKKKNKKGVSSGLACYMRLKKKPFYKNGDFNMRPTCGGPQLLK